MTPKTIAIVGTLDTKSEEVYFLARHVRQRGHAALVIDVGPLTDPCVTSDISNQAIAELAGWRLSELIGNRERDQIMAVMGSGLTRALLDRLQSGRLDGVIGIGGNQGSAIASMALKSLPIGFPKLLVSTVASGNIRPYIGHKDIAMMFSVTDLLGGPNPVSRSILSNAVSALVGMVEHGAPIVLKAGERTIALTALGNTEAAAVRMMQLLRAAGFQVITFHASGAGGTAMEELIEAGAISGVIDLTPHELAEEVVGYGAYAPVKPGRLTAAGRKAIPQVIATGALEYLCFGPRESIPPVLRKRKVYFHNPYNANVKISQAEMARIGKVMAERLNAAKGFTHVLIPTKGWSIYGSRGGPLYDPRGNSALLKALRSNLQAHIGVEMLDVHINAPQFADACVRVLLNSLERKV